MSSLYEKFAACITDFDYDDFCRDNTELIAAALKTADAFARGESTDDHAGYYSHERDYAAEKLIPSLESVGRVTLFRRGFLEGWNAARRFVIQDP
jgi:hypothetical protein